MREDQMMKIGFASRAITPPRPALIQGQMHRRIGQSALDPLTVTALVLDGVPDKAVFVSCDMAYISSSLCRAVRQRAASRLPDLPGDRIIMNSTHTHTSLVIEDGFYEHPGGDVMTPGESEVWVADRASEALVEAWETRKPRVLGNAFGHAVVGHNRGAVYYPDKHAEMYGKTDREDFAWIGGYEDHSLDMLFVWEPDGTLAGVALAIPCPSQVDENLEQFSADYWHEIRVELRRRLGARLQILPLCAPAGDQSPHFLIYGKQEQEMRRRRGLTERQEIAQRVGDAVERALRCTKPDPARDWPLRHLVKEVPLTRWQITKSERDDSQALYEQFAARGDKDSWWPRRLRWVVERFDNAAPPEPFPVEIHALRLGGLALATNPFELYLDYGLQIKARSPAAQTLLVQLTPVRDTWAYVPTERARQGGGYGAMPAISSVGPEGGRELVAATLALIGELWQG
jgi:hypothetical protein